MARSGGIAERRMLHAVAAATCGFGMLALCASHGPDAMYPASRALRAARPRCPCIPHPASRALHGLGAPAFRSAR
ncbi:hypothetical protein C1879_08270 [Paraeggerthella hongkongensis]|nr:hypothetical protein C1879_08270 [Paraeggerthella hongkongensis]